MAKRFALWYPRTHPGGRPAESAFGFRLWLLGFWLLSRQAIPRPRNSICIQHADRAAGPPLSSRVGLRIGRSDHRSIGSSGHRVIATRKTRISDHPIPQGGMHRSPDLPTVVLVKKSLLGVALLCSLVPAHESRAQTFELGGQPSSQTSKSQSNPKNKKGQKNAGESPPSNGGMGWGSSIEVGRNARAAQQALKRGDSAAAMTFAERMTQTAPNDARNWFLLGYTSRLAGKYPASLDAYQRGLARDPNSIEGLSGMAQTYMRMGQADEAKRLLLQVIAANPRRAIDLAMAGELFMQSGDLPRATSLLERSEAVQPSAHAELMLAIAYMKDKQTEKAKQFLDRAMRRSPGNTDIFRA